MLLLSKYTRYLSLVLLLSMHTGIGFFLGLWPFSLAMIVLDMPFVRDSSWVKAGQWIQRAYANVHRICRSDTGKHPELAGSPARQERWANAGSNANSE